MLIVYFLTRRLFTAYILIFLTKEPSLQVTILMHFSLLNSIYIAGERPYNGKMNIVEAFNELCMLLCMYLLSTFMICTNSGLSIKLSWVFIGICSLNILVHMGIILVSIVF